LEVEQLEAKITEHNFYSDAVLDQWIYWRK